VLEDTQKINLRSATKIKFSFMQGQLKLKILCVLSPLLIP